MHGTGADNRKAIAATSGRVSASGIPKHSAVLIYGAGSAGLSLAAEIRSNTALHTKVLGFLDDDPCKWSAALVGLPILGGGPDITRIVKRLQYPVTEILLAMPSATGPELRSSIGYCWEAGVPFRTLPHVSELRSANMCAQIRFVSPHDFLGRRLVRIDDDGIRQVIAGKSILVTGGCGSVGSELCRQIARFAPGKLVIFDRAESGMHMLALQLRRNHPDLTLVTEIGDIVRAQRVKEVLSSHNIGVVFHAAAYKHVPLMEKNIREAIENNVIGTFNVARWSHWAGVNTFVLISSDKAVNPSSIMGVTKRIAELIVAATPLDGDAKKGSYVSIRFGNIIGSSGSVIPIFDQQIACGGPVTLTHPDMRRYFMGISEAAQLVLQASAIAQGPEIFAFDLGEPVRIMDLAVDMIRLAGLTPERDVAIQITGLRPGEKLHEEYCFDYESVVSTPHEKIKRLRSNPPDRSEIAAWLKHLGDLLTVGDQQALRAHIRELVPEYRGSVVDRTMTASGESREEVGAPKLA